MTVERWAMAGRLGTVIGAMVCLALIAGGLLAHSAAFAGGGPEAGPGSVVMTIGLLIVYVVAGSVAGRVTGPRVTTALAEGTRIGAVIGAVWLVNHTIEVFTTASTKLSLVFFGAVFLLFGVAGLVGGRRTGSIGTGVVAAVWAAMTSSVILVIYGFLLAYLFMGRMAAIEAPDFARSGMHDAAAFTIANAISSAGSHLLEAPVIAAALGGVGALVQRATRTPQRTEA